MTRPVPRIIALTTCLLIGMCVAEAFGNEYNRINSLARKIHNKSKILLKETKHYRSTPNYAAMVREVAELDQLACHLRDIAKKEGDLDHLAYDIAKIDAKFHYVVKLFDSAELCINAYGRGSSKGRTAHVKRQLDSIEDAIHRIASDIEHLRVATLPLVKPAVVSSPLKRYDDRPIVTRVETYRVPSDIRSKARTPYRSGYSAPYGGANRAGNSGGGYGFDRGQPSGFYFGKGSSGITFRF